MLLQIGEAVSIPSEDIMTYFRELQLETIAKFQTECDTDSSPCGIILILLYLSYYSIHRSRSHNIR